MYGCLQLAYIYILVRLIYSSIILEVAPGSFSGAWASLKGYLDQPQHTLVQGRSQKLEEAHESHTHFSKTTLLMIGFTSSNTLQPRGGFRGGLLSSHGACRS